MRTYFLLVLILFAMLAQAQTSSRFTIPLYQKQIPFHKGNSVQEQYSFEGELDSIVRGVTIPTLTVFIPEKQNVDAPAVIIFPGGGYRAQLSNREGHHVAQVLNTHGITAMVLKYRLPNDEAMHQKKIVPLSDAQRALQLARQNSKTWGIHEDKIGVMGYSAGGHLAATTGTLFEKPVSNTVSPKEARPAFLILVNPVVSFMDGVAESGSRKALIGEQPALEDKKHFSAELHINANTPPTFLVHSYSDKVVPLTNTMLFFEGLQKYNIQSALHVYAKGDHGFISNTPPFDEWFGRCLYWLQTTQY